MLLHAVIATLPKELSVFSVWLTGPPESPHRSEAVISCSWIHRMVEKGFECPLRRMLSPLTVHHSCCVLNHPIAGVLKNMSRSIQLAAVATASFVASAALQAIPEDWAIERIVNSTLEVGSLIAVTLWLLGVDQTLSHLCGLAVNAFIWCAAWLLILRLSKWHRSGSFSSAVSAAVRASVDREAD